MAISGAHDKLHPIADSSNHTPSSVHDLNNMISDGSLELNSMQVCPVIVILGQSNADGRGRHSNLNEFLTDFYSNQHPNLKIYYKPAVRSGSTVTSGTKADDGEWWTLKPGHSDVEKYTNMTIGDSESTVAVQSADKHGAELQFGYEYDRIFPSKELRIIKFAIGGSKVSDHWLAAGGLYDTFMQYVYKPAIRDILRDGKKPLLLGVVWHQGESDSILQADADAYESNMNTLISNFRSDSGFENARWHIIQLSDYNGETYWSNVQAAQQSLADSDENILLTITNGSDGLPSVFRRLQDSDDIHLSSLGQCQTATRTFPNFNYNPFSEYTKCHDLEVFDAYTNPKNSYVNNPDLVEDGAYGSLMTGMYAGSGRCGFSWMQDNRGSRPRENTFAVRSVASGIGADFEAIMTGNKFTNGLTKPGIIYRADWESVVDPTSCYYVQMRFANKAVRLYSRFGGSWVVLQEYVFDNTLWNSLPEDIWIKAKAVGTSHIVYYSASEHPHDGDWVEIINQTNSDVSSGNFYLSLFNGWVYETDAYSYFREFYVDNL